MLGIVILLAHSYKLNGVCNAGNIPPADVSGCSSIKGFAQKSITREV